MMPTIVVSS